MAETVSIRPGTVFFESITKTSLVTFFFKIGVIVILMERVFEDNYLSLAFTPFTTRNFIGVHLWPSQIWFLLLGSVLAISDLYHKNLRIPTYLLKNAKPIFIVIGVYSLWTIYGILNGNDDAIRLFREMLYASFCFPAVLYLAQYVKVEEIFDRFFILSLLILVFLGINHSITDIVEFIYQPSNDIILVGMFSYSYFLFKSIRNSIYIVPAFLITLPILVNFNKSMIALISLMPVAILFLNTVFTKKKLKLSLNVRTLKIGLVFFVVLISIVSAGIYLNTLLNGQIETIIRETYLKERYSPTGEVYFGDITGGRFTLWSRGIQFWLESPLFGNGLGTPVPIHNKIQAAIHNYYIQALMDTGIVGTMLLTFGWVTWFSRIRSVLIKHPWSQIKIIYASLVAYVASFFIFAIYSLPMIYLGAAHFFWITIALLCVMTDEDFEQSEVVTSQESTH